VAAAFACTSAWSQGAASYPSRPVSVVIPYAPGGPADLETRLYTGKLTTMMGQPFVIDYKPGAGTALGSGYVAKAAPDGYTLLVVTGSLTVFPALFKDLNFDTVKDFAPVSLMSERTSVLLVTPDFVPKTFQEYIAFAKANPGKINFGTAGAGSITHLAGAWLHGATKTNATFVHYKGTGPIMPDLFSGRIEATAAGLLASLPAIKAGKVRALAVMGLHQSALLPGVRTIAESGIPGYNYSSWLGFSATGGTPTPIVNKLSETLAKVVKLPDVAGPLEAQGGRMIGSTPAQLQQLILDEIARWKKVVADSNIKLEQ
jgi:tripartite-type tricarboxylate transporter receptor subunit TctC